MHRTFVFPIKCESPQIPLQKPIVKTTPLGSYIIEERNGGDPDFTRKYDAFDKTEIIPDLIELVEKINKREKHHEHAENLDLILKWTKQWGFLKAENEDINGEMFYGERVGSFIDEAKKFYDLWYLYKAIANRDLHTLQEIIDVYEDPDPMFSTTHYFSFFFNKPYSSSNEGTLNKENPLKTYQIEGMKYLIGEIEENANKNRLYWSQIKYEHSTDQDHFTIVPGMGFRDLLDALYMQFFILLSENTKKICPVCNTPFAPERKDKVYCGESCKSTARSRRFRNRKASGI